MTDLNTQSHGSFRLGVDIGGTFTDVVLEGAGLRYSTKVLTTYAAPEEAIIAGLQSVCDMAGITPAQIGQIIHGTTLATNALIERRGARTALVTTEGFRDVIEMRTESRFEQYDLNLTLPAPLLPRNRRYTVNERMDARGQVLVPLCAQCLDQLADDLARGHYESIAIGLLHAYANDAHEHQVAEALAARLPGVHLSLSSQVSPQMREYERFNTTVANAYIKPLIASYLGRLKARLAEAGAACPVFLMHSGGGIMSVENAAEFPVRLVESGPAGGAIFAADLAARHGLNRVLSFDMGGTTAKICLIRDKTPKTARVFEVARSYRFKKGSGMPISIPVIDMVEIGAGGGSLGHVDALRQIRVGPESAGSEPGPACYGRGGTRPAVSDADLVLGKLDPNGFAGGRITLSPQAAQDALSSAIGDTLALDPMAAARGLTEVVDETMANAARVHAVENGEDLAEYTMIAFGGAAPLHAARLCDKLGISRCLVPEGAGVGSAIGFLRAPFSFEAQRSVFMRMQGFDAAQIKTLFADLSDEASAFVRHCDPDAPITCSYKVFMRYAGQGWDIPVPLSPEDAAAPDAQTFQARFEADYRRLFGRVVTGLDMEITLWSVTAATPVPEVTPVPAPPEARPASVSRHRDLCDPATGEIHSAAVTPRETLASGQILTGPALVPETETTSVVPPHAQLRNLGDGTLEITLPAKTGRPA